ncbi:MAG: F0F1 ATP synthase subunit A, partial [Clostridia bacterium]|nr:F0F1 ATP synthase subunit A [Clostridia bacterium]
MKAKKILVRLLILLSVLLIVGTLCLLVMTAGGGVTPPEESGGDEALISVEGARVILGIPALQKISEKIPLLELGNVLTTTAISLFTVSLILIILAALISRKIEKRPGKVQVVVEKLVTMLHNLVRDTMGEHNLKFMPYIGTLFLSSILGTLIGMTQIFPSATKDLSVTLAWAL